MWFDEPLDEDAVLETLRTRLLDALPGLRLARRALGRGRRCGPLGGGPGLRSGEPRDASISWAMTAQDEIQRFLESRMSEPLPRDRPLWHAHVLNAPDSSAVIMRFHHAIADGTALVRVLLDLTTDTPEGDSPDAQPHVPGAPRAEAPAVTNHPDLRPPHTELAPLDRTREGMTDRAARAVSQLVTLPLAAGVTATNSAADLMRMLDPDHRGSLVWKLTEQARGHRRRGRQARGGHRPGRPALRPPRSGQAGRLGTGL